MKPFTALALTAVLLAPAASPALDLQGHRGARGLAPENTLAGFARALAIGVTTLETDIGITADGVLVISHDPALNPDITRGPDGRYLESRGPLIHQTPFDDLRRYDVGRIKPGTRYATQHPDQQGADGARIPALAELFALVKRSGHPELRLSLETKLSPLAPADTAAPEPFARALIAAVREAGLAARTTIQSFDWRTLQVVQREAPEIATACLTAQQQWLDNVGAGSAAASPWAAGLKFSDHGSVPRLVKAAGCRIWSAHFADLDATGVREAQALGLQVLAWTVNDPAQIERVLGLGVDGVISDRPDRVREAMQRRGLALPRATRVAP